MNAAHVLLLSTTQQLLNISTNSSNFNNSNHHNNISQSNSNDDDIDLSNTDQAGLAKETAYITFVGFGVFIPIIGILGLAGNAFTYVKLSQTTRVIDSATMFLRLLAVTDFGIIVLAFVFLTYPSWATYNPMKYKYYLQNIYPQIYSLGRYLMFSTRFVNSWAMVLISVERYVSLLTPKKVDKLCTRKNFLKVITVLIIVSSLLNIPYFFEDEVKACAKDKDDNKKDGEDDATCYETSVSEYGKSPHFRAYATMFYLVVRLIIPGTILVIVNKRLARELKQMKFVRRSQGREDYFMSGSVALGKPLRIIYIVFFCMQTLIFIQQFDIFVRDSFGYDILMTLAYVLVILHSSVNFAIYMPFHRTVTVAFWQVFMRYRGRSSSEILLEQKASRVDPRPQAAGQVVVSKLLAFVAATKKANEGVTTNTTDVKDKAGVVVQEDPPTKTEDDSKVIPQNYA